MLANSIEEGGWTEVLRHERHIGSQPKEGVPLSETTSVVVAINEPAEAVSTFGPARSAGLAATLTLLAFMCIFSMGLKAWYKHKRNEHKVSKVSNNKDSPSSSQETKNIEKIKTDFNWERIMSK